MNRYWHVCYVIFFYHFIFTFHILHVIMIRNWHVCYVTSFLITLLHFICYMSSWINAVTCLWCYFFFSLHFSISYLTCYHDSILTCLLCYSFVIHFLHFIFYMSSSIDTYIIFYYFGIVYLIAYKKGFYGPRGLELPDELN